MVTIHRLTRPFAHRRFGHIGGKFEDNAELDPFQAIEITENVTLWAPSARPSDAHPAANEVRTAAVFDHGAQPIVPRGAAADLDANHSEPEVELVVHTEDPVDGHLEEPHRSLHRLAAQVHEGHWLEKHEIMVAKRDLRELALEFLTKAGRTPTPRQLIDQHESNVVAIARVFGPRVPEARDEMRAHGRPAA